MTSTVAKLPDYTGVTETPGTMITREAASMAISRYEIVRRLSRGRRVLEVACGSGQGLRYVAADAGRIVGGDVTAALLERASRHYGHSVALARFDAHDLPFPDRSFDVVEIHEAIYYMARPRRVFEECRRVLGPKGVLVVSSINPEWPDFNPSPLAVRYLEASELKTTLQALFGSVEILFGFAVGRAGASDVLLSVVKRLAVRLKLVPRTMRGKTFLKRIFLGPLIPVPAELTAGLAPIQEPHSASIDESSRYRIIYAVART